MTDNNTYIRVGTDYFKVMYKPNRYGVTEKTLKRWSKDILMLDFGKEFVRDIKSYNDFIIEPNNNGSLVSDMGEYYNMYAKFNHKPSAPDANDKHKGIYWTMVLMREIWGDQLKLGIKYMKALYKHPKKALPIVVLVSEERQTGKTTFLNYMNMLFGSNVSNIEPDVITRSFNAEYATKNIICIDEAVHEKVNAVEKIKSIVTKKSLSVSMKFVSAFEVPFYGKIIMASNNEKKFLRIDDQEIRFWIRKLKKPRITNHEIEDRILEEIPAFLYYLENNIEELSWEKSRMLFTAEQIRTNWLDAVVSESKSGLNKEINLLIAEWFDNNETKEFVELSPIDIKNEWFKNDSRSSAAYIGSVLKDEMGLQKAEKVSRYTTLHGDTKTGKPYMFERSKFTESETEKEDELPF